MSSKRRGVLLSGIALAMLIGCQHRVLPPEPVALNSHAVSAHRFPGVDVSRTATGGTSIRIIGAVAGEGKPLYVVDGTLVTLQPGQSLDWLSPDDITSIKVLNNVSETDLYGPRGVNGVVVITTRWAVDSRSR